MVGLTRAFSSMTGKVPKIKFNNGQQYPILGLGTWKSKPGLVTQAVKDAIDIGYRHIDGAHVYQNEAEVGKGIQAKLADGTVNREELYLTSKLWNTMHRPDLIEPAICTSLNAFGVDYLDLYLIHFPLALKEGGALLPVKEDGKAAFSDVDYVDTWKVMEKLVHKGLTKSIGVSNFNSIQLGRILDMATILPVTNQIEVHPYLNQKKLIKFCKSKCIVVTAYSPLGSGDRPWAKKGDPVVLKNPKIRSIAKRHNRTPAQVALRYGIQRGLIVLAKSVTKCRLKENFNIWDFHLCDEDIAEIDTLNCNFRFNPSNLWYGHKDHPFPPDNSIEF